MILKEFNYYLKKGTTLEDIQGSVLKKVNRRCDPTTGCIAHVYDTVLLKHWIVASDNVVGLYKLDNNILLFNDFQTIYDRLDKIEEALPKDDVKKDITDRLDKVEENLSNNQNELNEKRDELSNQENLKEKLEQEISALDKKIEEAKARGDDTTELERQKAEKERELATVTQNITNLTNEITNLEQKINNLLSQKNDIEKELEEHKPKEMAEKEYVDKRDNYILGQLESLIPKDPNRDSKKEEIENTDSSISSKEEELANKEKEIDSQKELAKGLSEEIDRLKREIEAAKARGEGTADLRKELANKEKELANTNSNISNLEKEKEEIKKELANLKGLKEELEKELDNIKPPEMVTIATNQTITGAKTFTSNITAPNITTMQNSINTLNSKVTNIESDVSNINNTISQVISSSVAPVGVYKTVNNKTIGANGDFKTIQEAFTYVQTHQKQSPNQQLRLTLLEDLNNEVLFFRGAWYPYLVIDCNGFVLADKLTIDLSCFLIHKLKLNGRLVAGNSILWLTGNMEINYQSNDYPGGCITGLAGAFIQIAGDTFKFSTTSNRSAFHSRGNGMIYLANNTVITQTTGANCFSVSNGGIIQLNGGLNLTGVTVPKTNQAANTITNAGLIIGNYYSIQ